MSARVPYTSPAAALKFPGKSAWKRAHYEIGLPCHCQAYVDVLTRGRWNALGYLVRSGESACFRAGKRANTPVFCRCQVHPMDGDAVAQTNTDAGIPGFEELEMAA